MARLHAGIFRHRITILEKTVTRDGYGAEIVTWTTQGTYWASVEPIRGREFVEMKQAQAEVSHRIRMRVATGIKPEMRVSFDGREFEIDSVINVRERDRELQLMCRERVD